MECARCHDHKYDPLTQKEYYELCAFFDNIDEAGLYSYFTPAIPTPTLRLTDDNAKQKLEELQKRVDEEQQKLERLTQGRESAFREWRTNVESHSNDAVVAGALKHLTFDEVARRISQSQERLGKALGLREMTELV